MKKYMAVPCYKIFTRIGRGTLVNEPDVLVFGESDRDGMTSPALPMSSIVSFVSCSTQLLHCPNCSCIFIRYHICLSSTSRTLHCQIYLSKDQKHRNLMVSPSGILACVLPIRYVSSVSITFIYMQIPFYICPRQ